MRVMAFSDLHHSRRRAETLVRAAADADLVIGAGDFCNMRQELPGAMNLLSGFAAPFVVVPGNAESEEELHEAAHEGTHVLHGHAVEIAGIRIFGLGYGVPKTPFGDWSCDLDEEQAEAVLAHCPQVDVLVTHSPPKGIADQTSTGLSVGSRAIADAIERVQPKLAVCGHIHDSWGQTGMIGTTKIVNLGPRPNWFEL